MEGVSVAAMSQARRGRLRVRFRELGCAARPTACTRVHAGCFFAEPHSSIYGLFVPQNTDSYSVREAPVVEYLVGTLLAFVGTSGASRSQLRLPCAPRHMYNR